MAGKMQVGTGRENISPVKSAGNTAHRSTPLEAFSFELYENYPVKFLDTVRFPSKEAHTNVKLRVKLRGKA